MSESKHAFRLERAWRGVGWIGVGVVIVVSLFPDPLSLTAFEQEDKIGHAAAYAVLMLWFAQLHLARGPRLRIAAGLLALGVALELVQGWTGVRTFSYADMAADALGVALGWLAAPPRGPNLLARCARAFAGAS